MYKLGKPASTYLILCAKTNKFGRSELPGVVEELIEGMAFFCHELTVAPSSQLGQVSMMVNGVPREDSNCRRKGLQPSLMCENSLCDTRHSNQLFDREDYSRE